MAPNVEERLASLETKVDLLLELRGPLRDMSRAIILHTEKLDNIEEKVIPPMLDEIEKGKKFRWVAAGVSAVLGFLGGLLEEFSK